MNWVFVTGPPGSGTTVAAWAISQHPAATILHETGFPVCLYRALAPPGHEQTCGYMQATFTERRVSDPAPVSWCLSRLWSPQYTGTLPLVTTPCDIARALSSLLASCYQEPSNFFGDKHHIYCRDWPLVEKIFEERVKWIVTARSPGASVRSYMSRHAPGEDFDAYLRDHNESLNGLASLRDYAGERVKTIPCEEFDDDPQGVIAEMLLHVGLDLDDYPWERVLIDLKEKRNGDLLQGS